MIHLGLIKKSKVTPDKGNNETNTGLEIKGEYHVQKLKDLHKMEKQV